MCSDIHLASGVASQNCTVVRITDKLMSMVELPPIFYERVRKEEKIRVGAVTRQTFFSSR